MTDLGIPGYGTNGGVGPQQSHHNIFDMFQNFLGHFWGADRTGMFQNVDNTIDVASKAFPGIGGRLEQANSMIQDSSNPVGQIFGQLFKGQDQ